MDVNQARRARAAWLALASVLIATNVVLLGIAASDRSWGAFFIAIVIGPIANGVIALVSLLLSGPLRRLTGASQRRHVTLSLALPAAAIVLDAFVILSMDLRGG